MPTRFSDRAREQLFVGLAQSIDAGLPVTAAVAGALGPLLSPASGALVRRAAETGRTFVEVLSLGVELSPADLALLRAGETHGGLPSALRTMAARAKRARESRGKILLTLAYPAVLLLVASVFVPVATIVTDGFGAYLAAALPLPASMATVAIVAFVVWPRLGPDHPARRVAATVAHALPLVGAYTRQQALATFCDVLGTCVRAGLPLRQSLTLAADAGGSHPSIAGRGPALVERLERGGTLADVVSTIPGFPPSSLAVVAIGEQTGTLDEALARLADEHGERARSSLTIAIVALGVVAGAVAVGFAAWSIVSSWIGIYRRVDEALKP